VIWFDLPTEPSSECLDRYLADGCFRAGSVMAYTPIVPCQGDVFAAVPVRARLAGYRFRKSQRRILRRNGRLLRVEIGPALGDAARERLYRLAQQRFSGYMYDSLSIMLDAEPFASLFETYEVAVYEEERLVAVSFFDVGRSSVASLLGLYDPEYARYGLGIYTMLVEIEHAIESGYRYYYPGFILLQNGRFDYKLGLGRMQFRSEDGRWRALSALPRRSRLCERIHRRVGELERHLARVGRGWQRRINPFFALSYVQGLGEDPAVAPLLLESPRGAGRRTGKRFPIAEYLPNEDVYAIGNATESSFLSSMVEGRPSPEMTAATYLARPLVRRGVMWQGADARDAAERALQLEELETEPAGPRVTTPGR